MLYIFCVLFLTEFVFTLHKYLSDRKFSSGHFFILIFLLLLFFIDRKFFYSQCSANKIFENKIFEKKITKKEKALGKVKQYGGKALKVLSFINPYARVGSLLYKAGRAIYLRKQIRDTKLIADTILRRTPIRGNVVIQPAKGTKLSLIHI